MKGKKNIMGIAKQKKLFFFVGLSVIILSLLGFTIYQFVSVNILVGRLQGQWAKMMDVNGIHEGVVTQFNAVNSYLVDHDNQYAEQFLQDAIDNRQQIEQLVKVTGPARKPLVRKLLVDEETYTNLVNQKVIPVAREGDFNEGALILRQNGGYELADETLGLAQQVQNVRQQNSLDMLKESARQLQSALWWGFGTGVLALIAVIIAGFMINKKVTMEGLIYRMVLMTSKNAIVVINQSGNIHEINPVAEHLFGIPGSQKSAIVGCPFKEFFSCCYQPDGTTIGEVIDEVQNTGVDMCNIECAYAPEGQPVFILLTDCVALRHGGQYGCILVFRDISERKAIEDELRSQVIRDSMTGLYNHSYILRVLDEEVRSSVTGSNRLAFLLIDVDNFKNYNDQFGHLEGDQVLIKLSRLLESLVRKRDVVARYGGDEFAVTLLGADLGKAFEVGKRIRNTVMEFPFPHRELTVNGKITVSVGIACCPYDASTVDDVIKKADEAMYSAKRHAKNSVEVWNTAFNELCEDWPNDDSLLHTVGGFLSMVMDKDRYTHGHSQKVAYYTAELAKLVGMSSDEVRTIKLAAFLHDIGKIDVPSDILAKAGHLTDAERIVCQLHPVTGAKIISSVESLRSLVPIIRYHHERFDGKGYPDGLRGTHIPVGARIIAIADSFDAMISERPYRKPKSVDDAIEEIRKEAGSQFDPHLVGIFVDKVSLNHVLGEVGCRSSHSLA